MISVGSAWIVFHHTASMSVFGTRSESGLPTL